MKTVRITESFDGYPDYSPEKGKEGEEGYQPAASGKRRSFTKGETVDVPAAFAKVIVDKGHAEFVAGKAADKPAETEAKADDASAKKGRGA